VVDAMLTATDGNGQPDMALRARPAELRLPFPAAFEAAGEDDLADALPEGVYRVYPLPKEYPRSEGVYRVYPLPKE
jgi:hypothetical protein